MISSRICRAARARLAFGSQVVDIANGSTISRVLVDSASRGAPEALEECSESGGRRDAGDAVSKSDGARVEDRSLSSRAIAQRSTVVHRCAARTEMPEEDCRRPLQ